MTSRDIDLFHRLKRHYSQYAPNMEQLKARYEAAMKEKMLANLERDRAVGQVSGLQSTLKSMEGFHGNAKFYILLHCSTTLS